MVVAVMKFSYTVEEVEENLLTGFGLVGDLQTWKKRWFVLRSSKIAYYKDDKVGFSTFSVYSFRRQILLPSF